MVQLTSQLFHSWVVREQVGAGGVAEVFRVEHADDPRSTAALKVLRAELVGERRHEQALEREHGILAALDHPGIPKARRLGEIAGRSALLMDYVPGRTLAQIVADREPFDRSRALTELVGIIAYLHGRSIVHNDIKPENAIFAEAGRLALVDFGSAREPRGTSLFRRFFGRPTAVFGTAGYLAPELIGGHQPTFASDLYALGVCAFLILSGSPPFAASSRSERLHANAHEAPPTIRDRLPQLPARIVKAIDACLDKRPMARGTVAALLAALDGLAAAMPPGPTRRFTMRAGRRTKSYRKR